MLNIKKTWLFAIFFIVLIILILLLVFDRAKQDFNYALKKVPQNVFAYIVPNEMNQLIMSSEQQKQEEQTFLARYFAPWSDDPFAFSPVIKNPIYNIEAVRSFEQNFIDEFAKAPGYGINRIIYPQNKFAAVIANMDMAHLSDHFQRAIVVTATNIRVLPTRAPSYANWNQPGEGYPFDYLQEAYIAPNLPVLILHTSRDKAWSLILTSSDIGWVPSQALAPVGPSFINRWKRGPFVAALKDGIAISDTSGRFYYLTRIGSIYPMASNTSAKKVSILVAVNSDTNQATIKTAFLPASAVSQWPLTFTKYNMAIMMNHLLNVPYGWGDINGYRDCSQTMQDLFAAFGLWLPRNSSDQALMGKIIDLEKLSPAKKIALIKEQGVPFLTLLRIPGHIVLYFATKNNKVYIFHDFWGVHTRNILGQRGRAIIGKTAITPVNLGAGYINVPKNYIDVITGMVILK